MEKNLIEKIDNLFSINIFNYKNIFVLVFSFISIVFFSNYTVKSICKKIVKSNYLRYWPINYSFASHGIYRRRLPSWRNNSNFSVHISIFHVPNCFIPARYRNFSTRKNILLFLVFIQTIILMQMFGFYCW